MHLLNAADLGYGAVPVLRGIDLHVATGEWVALLGHSGAGKSTLLAAARLALMDQGLRVALVPQDHALVPQLSALRNVLMGRLDDHGAVYNLATLVRPRRADRAAALAVLASVGLTSQADRAVETLSGGQKQRVALARALYRGGDVLIADEPLSAVDPAQAEALATVIRNAFPTAIIALHDVGLALGMATRLIGLNGGRIVLDGPATTPRDQIEALYAR
ncbi:ATP-binding cassette domain-containing protein [Paracoccus sp. M683]|uniref:ATP-binding cassette domain-containing protein n=1 Tax=Paracoccus sp. M683 TaxID=2594268 RepID=UPI00117F5B90|nr:ATP-binding cassette domain-containing protein [Paracoccus sp. M683]TRW99544.1 ATP-binding cassette domain-containing protein [Paracoccus sp. M683]